MRRTIANQLQGNAHRGVRFAAQRLGWTLVHTYDFARVLDVQTWPIDRRDAGAEIFKEGGLANEDQLQEGIPGQKGNTGRNNAVGTEVPTHCINRDDWCGQGLLVRALVYDLAAAIETVRGDVVAQMHFTGALFYGQSVRIESIVGTTHVTSGTGFFVLLNSHD